MKIALKDPLFVQALPIFNKIADAGYQAYFVGGCVRDTILGLPIHDIDIATSARPEEIEAIFPITIDVGKEHGTIIVVHQQASYEVTTFRTESDYSDYRHPDSVDFVRTLQEDTLRRDFTINALAFDQEGRLYDYHGGAQDIERRLIRAVGHPADRFKEDALRIVRAIRFASQLGFDIDGPTLAAIRQEAHLLPKIAIERVRIEMSKFFAGPYFNQVADLIWQANIAQALPLLRDYPLPVAMSHMTKKMQGHQGLAESVHWHLFCQGLGIEARQTYLRKWSHSNQLILEVEQAATLEPIIVEGQLSPWEVYAYPMFLVEDLMRIHGQDPAIAHHLAQTLPILSKKDLCVSGKVMMDWLGLSQGNASLGKVIKLVERAVVMGQLKNDPGAIKDFVLANYSA